MTSNNERQEYLDMFYESTLTENEFVRLLLPYLCKQGIRTIREDELAKKLFPYYKNEKYKPLFSDLIKDRYEDKVNIANGIYSEKYFSGNIMWTSNNPDSLRLLYGKDFDTSSYEKGIDSRLIELLSNIANDLGARNKIETGILNVYGYNPNKRYNLIAAESFGTYQSELITDGEIKKEQSSIILPDTMYMDPTESSSYRTYKTGISRTVSIKNSSFVAIQGIYNEEIQRIAVFTEVTDVEKLLKIKEIAQQIQSDSDSLLVCDKPYIRKLALKL